MQPISRTTDPESSHQAGEHLTDSGKRQRQIDMCVNAVRKHPYMNTRELSALTGIDNEILHKRLPESCLVKASDKMYKSFLGFAPARIWSVK